MSVDFGHIRCGDKEHETQNQGECWCKPVLYKTVGEVEIWVHRCPCGEEPPAEVLELAIGNAILEEALGE